MLRTLCLALALQTLLHLSRPASEHQAQHRCLEPCPLYRLQSSMHVYGLELIRGWWSEGMR